MKIQETAHSIFASFTRHIQNNTKKFFLLILVLVFFALSLHPNVKSKIPNFDELDWRKFDMENYKIDEDRMLKVDSKQIFFIESKLNDEKNLTAKQACSIESAARMNPELNINFLFATKNQAMKVNRDWIDVLLTYKNIHFRFFNLFDYAKETPLEKFMNGKLWEKSGYVTEHLSDISRFLTLFKYGGLYLDLDVITLMPFRAINLTNFVLVERNDGLASCILHFDTKNGRKITEMFLKEVNDSFTPHTWSGNGPGLITRVVKKICPDAKLKPKEYFECGNLHILESVKGFPIGNEDYNKFYEEENAQATMNAMKNSWFVHIWNKMLHHLSKVKNPELSVNSTAPYIQLARLYCPRVYDKLDEYL